MLHGGHIFISLSTASLSVWQHCFQPDWNGSRGHCPDINVGQSTLRKETPRAEIHQSPQLLAEQKHVGFWGTAQVWSHLTGEWEALGDRAKCTVRSWSPVEVVAFTYWLVHCAELWRDNFKSSYMFERIILLKTELVLSLLQVPAGLHLLVKSEYDDTEIMS